MAYGPSQPYMNTGYAGTPSTGLSYKGEFDEAAYRRYIEYFRKYGLGRDAAYGPANKQVLYTSGSQSAFSPGAGSSAISPYAIPGADNKAAYMKAYEQVRQETLQSELARANQTANANGMPLSEGYMSQVLEKMLKPSDYSPAARGTSRANPSAELKIDLKKAEELDKIQTASQLERDKAKSEQKAALEKDKAAWRMELEQARLQAKTLEDQQNAAAITALIRDATSQGELNAAIQYAKDFINKIGPEGVASTGLPAARAAIAAQAESDEAKQKARAEADAARNAAIEARAEATRRWQAAMRTAGNEQARTVATQKELNEATVALNETQAFVDSLPENDVRKAEYQAVLAAKQAAVDFWQAQMGAVGQAGGLMTQSEFIADFTANTGRSPTQQEILNAQGKYWQ